MCKVLVSDYDNTFFTDEVSVKKNVKAVDEFRKKGNIFIIATGRSSFLYEEKRKDYKIESDYVILNHGATIIDIKGNLLFNFTIGDDIVKKLKKCLLLDNCKKCICSRGLESHESIETNHLTKIQVVYNSYEDMSKVYNNIVENFRCLKCYIVGTNKIEIISSNTDKNIAISKICKNANNVYTIGDSYNDISMIEKYKGFCMENSIPELSLNYKKYATVADLVYDILNKVV